MADDGRDALNDLTSTNKEKPLGKLMKPLNLKKKKGLVYYFIGKSNLKQRTL